eukprot:GEMP01008097.1.p1 GENE.GEMP01008097.1~~GEMP01008097.1.p1  ORF type:complete len:957 (+),score=160.17 GEMP01008097.1:96-2966(+)
MTDQIFDLLREAKFPAIDEGFHIVRRRAVEFFKHEVPDLLIHTAQAMRKADYESPLTMSRLLDLAPIVGAIIVACSLPFLLLWNDRTTETYHLTRKVIIKLQALLYAMGFSVSAIQHRALWGSQGLSPLKPSYHRPSPIFQFFGFGDLELEAVSWAGLCIAVIVLRYSEAAVSGLMFAMWVMYLSIVNLQAPFTYSYGWEWGTLELGFLAIFFVPLVPDQSALPPSRVVIWLYRWAAFRLLLGAGMSKVGRNSSACWRELTCTDTHYYTQPIPNPLSWYFHFLPSGIHRLEIALTFFEQLCLPWLMLVPNRICRYITGTLEIFFQLCIVGTGNYAWINFYGMLPVMALFDDDFFRFFLDNRVVSFLIPPGSKMKHSLSMEDKVKAVSSKLQQVKSKAWKKNSKWYSGQDVDKIFEDEHVAVFISDCYAAWNPTVLTDFHIVVNMMGSPETYDKYHELYGPQWHWDQDKKYEHDPADKSIVDMDGGSRERVEAIERYMRGPKEFYDALGIRYVEEASADSCATWCDMKAIIQSVNTKLGRILAGKSSMFKRRGVAKTNILFHCYGGRNRSGAALCGFWWWWWCHQNKAPSIKMEEVICDLGKIRPNTLSRKKRYESGNHEHFVEQLLEYEEEGRRPKASWLKRLYRWGHGLAIAALACVIAVKSVDPLRELFTPAPWINTYDPLFIMNSQGVFGFINQHRLQPVFEFTHNVNTTIEWKPLDFKCLPGSVDRTPCLMSPYHYRLDWETWIRTTASLEDFIHHPHGGEVLQENLPPFLRNLINRLLHGDDDAMGLMGRPDLYDDGPPTAVRVQFYSYTFDPSGKNTWSRKPLGPARVYKKSNLGPGRIVRRSPRERHWILGAAVLGCVFELCVISPLVVSYLAVFAAAFMADYELLYSASLYLFSNFIAGVTFMGLLLPLYARRKGNAVAQDYVKKQWYNLVAFAAMAFYSYNAYRSYI